MPQNARLAGALLTEEKTSAVARWLIDLAVRYALAAPYGAMERQVGEQVARATEKALKHYLDHRKQGDPQRTSSHEQLCQKVRLSLTTLRNNYLLNYSPEGGIFRSPEVKAADYEEAVEKRIAGNLWTFQCTRCGGSRVGDTIDGRYLCADCQAGYSRVCHHCQERHLVANMQQLVAEDGDDAWVCCTKQRNCVSQLQASNCDGCGLLFLGEANHAAGHDLRLALEAQGVCACANCAPRYHQLDCGHYWPNDGHPRETVEDTEDDNRIREHVMASRERVCGRCREQIEADAEPDYWRQQIPLLQGTLFTEVGSTRTYGVELEFCAVRKMPSMDDDLKKYWTAKEDASLPRNGVEMASTILHGDEGLERIRELCDYAEEHHWSVDARAGMHLHVGLKEDTANQVAAIAMGYTMTYEMWRWFVPPSRSANCKYCRKTAIASKGLLGSPFDSYVRILTDVNDRRVWCNWHSYVARQTVELRIHHATKKYDKIANWIKAHTRFCDWCADIGDPKKVYDRLKDIEHEPRKLFLLIAQEAWKDRELGRWYRQRAEVLHGTKSRLHSLRRIKRLGIAPHTAAPRERTYRGVVAYVGKHGGHWYVSNHPEPLHASRYIGTDNEWGTGGVNVWRTQEEAELWLAQNEDHQPAPPPARRRPAIDPAIVAALPADIRGLEELLTTDIQPAAREVAF